MAQKLLNTRIGLKYDSYSNWTRKGDWSQDGKTFTDNEQGQSTFWAGFKPLKGEVCFFEIPSPKPEGSPVANPPAILFKVGDGNETTLENLPWGSAIAADVYEWAKQISLLGGTNNGGTWTWSEDSVYSQEQAEVAAFIKKETANIKIRIVHVATPIGETGDDWYDTEVSTDGGTNWTASNTPFQIDIEAYTAGPGLELQGTEFSIKNNSSYLSVDSSDGLDTIISEVEFTGSGDGIDLTATTGLLTDQAVGEIKEYIDAKAQQVNTEITVDETQTPTTGYLKTYQIKQDGTVKGVIDIPKDFLVKSATSSVVTAEDKEEGGKFYNNSEYQVGDHYLDFVINVKEGSATDEHVYVNVKNIVDAYTAGTGLVLSGTEFSIDKYSGNIADATSGTGIDKFVDAKQVKDFVDDEIEGAIQAAQDYTDEAISHITVPTHTAGDGIEITETGSGSGVDIAVKLGIGGSGSGEDSGLAFDNNGGLIIDDSLVWVWQCGGAENNI